MTPLKLQRDFFLPLVISIGSLFFSIFLLGLISLNFFHNPRVFSGILEAWNVWDAPHYLEIAQNWYAPTGELANFIVFLPLFPLILTTLNLLPGAGLLKLGFFVSIISSLLSSLVFYELVRIDFDKKVSIAALLTLFSFPTAFFLFIPYPESTFLLLCLATFLSLRKGKFLWGSFFAMLATATKIAGLALIPVIFVELILYHRKTLLPLKLFKTIIIVNLPMAGFLTYLLINFWTFGDLFYFEKVQQNNWNTNFTLAFSGLKQAINFTFDPSPERSLYLGYAQIAAFTLGLFTTIYSFFKLRKSYFVFSLVSLFLYSSMSYWLSLPRYLLSIFPVFIMLGKSLNKPLYLVTWIAVSLIFLLIFGTITLEHGPVL